MAKDKSRVLLFLCGRPGMKGVAAYLRVSTDQQSSSHQHASIISYALSLGYKEKDLIFYTDEGVRLGYHRCRTWGARRCQIRCIGYNDKP